MEGCDCLEECGECCDDCFSAWTGRHGVISEPLLDDPVDVPSDGDEEMEVEPQVDYEDDEPCDEPVASVSRSFVPPGREAIGDPYGEYLKRAKIGK